MVSPESNKKNKLRINLTSAVNKIKLKLPWPKRDKGNGLKSDDDGYKQTELDKKLVFSLSKSRIPSFKQLKYIKRFLSSREKWVIRISLVIIAINILVISTVFYLRNLQEVPTVGGDYTEALLGAPKYINPLYASVSDVDNDLSLLLYSALFKRGKNGELVNDLADNYEKSEDNKIYTFTIKPSVKWHDDSDLTVDDVVFTFNAVKDSNYKSPLKNSFGGVEIQKIDERSFTFNLVEPYAAFLELLTFGIIPAGIWSQIPPESATLAELNLKPIGSGPYKFDKLVKDKNGNIREYFLKINENYYGEQPYLNLKFVFFSGFEEAVEALNNNVVQGISYLPPNYKNEILTPKAYNRQKLYLPQMTLLFLNQKNNPALGDRALRQALAYALNRNDIINNILVGDAYAVHGPVLSNSFAYNNEIKQYDYNPGKAVELLDSVDWKLVEVTEEMITQAEEDRQSEDEAVRQAAETVLMVGAGNWRKKNDSYLIIRISTVDRNENSKIIDTIKNFWEKIGIKALVEIYPVATIQKEVIKTRNFDVLFYGQVMGADPDPYVFWHSSQTGEGGFNIANFANKEVDKLLEDARLIPDLNERRDKYIRFQEIIAEEEPVIFMYSPLYTYLQSNNIKGFEVYNILLPRDRFANVNDWYIKTGKKLIWGSQDDE